MRPFIIGICGGSGSGKTTLAEHIKKELGTEALLMFHDNYYHDDEHLSERERAERNYDHPAAFDTPLLISHLQALAAGEAVEAPLYDYTTHKRKEQTLRLFPAPVILLDGILIFESAPLRELLDLKIFVDTDADLRLLRRIHRDMPLRGRSIEQIMGQYLATVRPMHEAFVEPTKKYADLIVPEGGKNPVALDMIIKAIRTNIGG